MAEQVYQVALNAAEDNPALTLSAADADNAITMTSGPGDAVSAEAAEAWAVGTRNGVPVQSGDATYENHSKYWAGQSESYVDDAEAWANGTRDGVPVDSTDETFEKNSKYWATVAMEDVLSERVIRYGVCETAANVQEKAVTVTNFARIEGAWVCVRFQNTNTVSSIKLNVNNTGAAWVEYNGYGFGGGSVNNRYTYLFV